jgi:hypothetical protein
MGRVELRVEPSYSDMLYIAENLRERDREELFATRYGENPADLARDAVATGAFRWAAYLDGEPVAAIGAFPRWPRVWTAWAYGTDKWPKVVLTLTKHARRFMFPAILNSGAIRMDALALSTHTDARAWLGVLGALPEKHLDKWGKNGQTFVSYVWTRKSAQTAILATRRKPTQPNR